MWSSKIIKERDRLEAETGVPIQYLIARPELYTVLCEEAGLTEFGQMEEFSGMILYVSDIQAEEYVFAVNVKNIEA
jgi:hypothetical protein